MKNKVKKVNFRRDDVLTSNVELAGFITFFVGTFVTALITGTDLLTRNVTFSEVIVPLKFIGSNVMLFIATLFYIHVAVKKHFNNTSAFVVTVILSILSGIKIYMTDIKTWWLFIILWVSISIVIYYVVKLLFKSLSDSLPDYK